MVFGTSTHHAHTHLSFQPHRQSRTCKVTNMLYAHLHLSEYLVQVSRTLRTATKTKNQAWNANEARTKIFKIKTQLTPRVYEEIYNLIGANRSLRQNFDYWHHVIVIADWVRSLSRPRHPGWMAVSITFLTVVSVQLCAPKCTISLWWLVGIKKYKYWLD